MYQYTLIGHAQILRLVENQKHFFTGFSGLGKDLVPFIDHLFVSISLP